MMAVVWWPCMRWWPWDGGHRVVAMAWWPWGHGHRVVAVGWWPWGQHLTPPGAGVCSEFLVKTANAGAGALAVTIDGPSKVKLDCVECAEGHRVTYTPMAPGNYLISIKYGGPHHIVGSPFKAKVTGTEQGGGDGSQGVPRVTWWRVLGVTRWLPQGHMLGTPRVTGWGSLGRGGGGWGGAAWWFPQGGPPRPW